MLKRIAHLAKAGAALAWLAACTPQTAAPTLSRTDQDDLARITAYLNALPRFEARFVQSGDYGPGTGLVWLDRPGHLRVDFAGPGAPVMVITNGRVRLLDRGTGAITTQPVSRTPLGLLLTPQISLDGAVTVDQLSHGANSLRVVLSKTGAAAQGTLTLDFAEQPLRLVAVSVIDPYRHVRTLALSDIDAHPVVTPDLFLPPSRGS
jgi:outer membrane lipoprotein-sorting protein